MKVQGMGNGLKKLQLTLCLCAALSVALTPAAAIAQDAATAPAAKPVTFLGTVQTLNGKAITIKNDAGATMQVTVQEDARVLRIEPGQKTLAGASPFNLGELQTGDRVMARGAAEGDGKSLAASLLVAIKGADIAQKQAREREDWQKNGTGGLVKLVDPTASTITVSLGTGGDRTELIHVTSATILRRYAPGSIKFDQATAGTFDQIKAGDQLRARGTKAADGTTLEAAEIVSGRFENIAGTIVSVDSAASTITVTDATTKKPVVVHVGPDSELKKLDPAVAQRVAQRLGGAGKGSEGAPAAGGPRPTGAGPGADHAPSGAGPGPGPGTASASGPDFQQLLSRSPSIPLKDLQKGNMVVVVASREQASDAVTAITVVAGVEPMLHTSTSGSQAMLSAWNLGGQGGGGEQ